MGIYVDLSDAVPAFLMCTSHLCALTELIKRAGAQGGEEPLLSSTAVLQEWWWMLRKGDELECNIFRRYKKK